jgi:phosphoglycolate phosphatase-like HAD superfamily hydrolase
VTFKLPIPPGVFEAYLFDCDGTVADSMPLHYLAWKQVLGMRLALGVITRAHKHLELVQQPDSTQRRFDRITRAAWDDCKRNPPVLVINVFPHFRDALQLGKVFKVEILFSLRHFSQGHMNSLLATEEFNNLNDRKTSQLIKTLFRKTTSPLAEPFLVAAQRLGVSPEACLVFEDTQMGIVSARAAGMAFVHVPAPWERSTKTRKCEMN